MRIILTLLLLCAASRAEDLYFGQASAGSNNGSSCVNQFAVTFFNTAGNWGAGAGKISAGDTVHVCGTVTTQLTAQGSGTNGSPVTILFETSAKISLPACDASNGCLNIANRSYIIVDGGTVCGYVAQASVACNGTIEDTANGSGLANQANSVAIVADSCNSCEVRYLNCSNIYVHTSLTDETNGTFRCVQNGSGTTAGSTFLVHHNIMHDVGSAITYVPGPADPGPQVYNNYFYRNNSSVDLSNNSNGALVGALIHDNHFGTTANWDSTTGPCFAHHNSLHSFAFGTGTNEGVSFYNNLADGDWGTCMTSALFFEAGHNGNSKVYNNYFAPVYTQANNGIVSYSGDGSGGDSAFYNNTIIGLNLPGGDICLAIGSAAGNHVEVENNVIGSCGTLLLLQSATITTWDYNVYGQMTSGGTLANNGTGYTTLATWQAACSCDSHSVFGGTTAGYLKVSSAGALQFASPAIGFGTNLTSLGITTLNSDAIGSGRSGISAWDAGWLNYVSPNTGLLSGGLMSGGVLK